MRSSSINDLSLAEREYSILRQTIAVRGTVRMVILPAILAVWAALALVQLAYTPLPLGSLTSLLVLAGGFEAINALHVGVERIGRYLQVFYEESASDTSVGAKWETTAMAGGPALPGGGLDPLFTLLFAGALLLNLAVGLLPWPTPAEGGVVGLFHVLGLVRILRARTAAGKQRAHDLEHYRRLRESRL